MARKLGQEGMEIHKPKRVHNWRELLSEVGVVVIGVLIALGAEQVVEDIHWSKEVASARRATTTNSLPSFHASS